MINLFQPAVGDEELSAVADVFRDKWLGHGPRTKAFETAFAEHLGVEPDRVLFLASGTAGLFLAVESLGLAGGDEVVMPSMSFLAAANAVLASGARPVFCDVDPRTMNPSWDDIEAALTPRTRAVLLLHYGGQPGHVAEIAGHCRERGLTLIEDSACSIASTVGGRTVGTFGDLAMWSLDAAKILTTGDGGLLYVRDAEQAARVRRLAYHGLTRATGLGYARVSHRWWELEVPEIGRRVIGNDLTAAIGTVQLRRLPEFVARRREIVERYDQELADVAGLRLPPPLPGHHTSSHYFYWVQMDAAIRDGVAADLLAADIYTTFRYAPLHKVSAYGSDKVLPATDRAAGGTLCLPLHHGLGDDDVLTVTRRLHEAVAARGRAVGTA
ncbi:DegT/DnrJ/EryC1/StrS family aminotransferase [Streptomyces sp. NPDC094049]|uniref:DegT/DnrJ/EryC1/StrS family aminotransferase n=1 Tax=Streptomyces sp. NPDC094049 TaxID=3154987 RepID=UPI00332DFFDD